MRGRLPAALRSAESGGQGLPFRAPQTRRSRRPLGAVAAGAGSHKSSSSGPGQRKSTTARRRRGEQHASMGLAERLAAHQNKEEEDDRPLTEDEELAKRMAERSWAERQEEPEGLKRIKRMGKQMAPDRTSAHLAMRFGARAALLEAFRDARKQQIAKGKATPMTGTSTVATMEATMTDHQKAQIWRFNSQTQMGLEIPFWLALDCLMQRELCGRACLGRAPLDREAWVVGKKQEKMYVVVKGSACVVEASEGGGTPSSSTMASEEEVTDKAMVEGPIWRKDPANDLRRKPRTCSVPQGARRRPGMPDEGLLRC